MMQSNESEQEDHNFELLNEKLESLQDIMLKMKVDFALVSRSQIENDINSQIIKSSEEMVNIFLDNRPVECKVMNQCTTIIQKMMMKVLRVFSEKGYYKAYELLNKYIISTNNYFENGVCQDGTCFENAKSILATIKSYIDTSDRKSKSNLKELLNRESDFEKFEGNEKSESKFMSVLGNEIRLKILKELSKGSNYYTQLERLMGLKGGHFSFHLKELKDADFVKISEDDKSYQITTRGLKALNMIFELSR